MAKTTSIQQHADYKSNFQNIVVGKSVKQGKGKKEKEGK